MLVDELEDAISVLRQNNTAISDMIESRDSLISELNNRVQVFEEDKMVLKAALKQLQKDFREQTPVHAKVRDDLKNALDEIEVLNDEIANLNEFHDAEVKALEEAIESKNEEIEAAESKLKTIGGYVDQLEERLALFKLAKREVHTKELELNDREAEYVRVKEEEATRMKKVEEELRVLREKENNFINRLQILEREKKTAHNDNIELKTNLDDAQKEIEFLKKQLDKLTTAKEEKIVEEVVEKVSFIHSEVHDNNALQHNIEVSDNDAYSDYDVEEDETEEEEAIVPLRSLDIKEPMDKFEEYVSPEKVFQLNFNRKASSKAPSQQIAPTPSDEDNIEYFDPSLSDFKSAHDVIPSTEDPKISVQENVGEGGPSIPKMPARKLPSKHKVDDTRPPLRKIRKAFARTTGMHGFFSSRSKTRESGTRLDATSNDDRGRPPPLPKKIK